MSDRTSSNGFFWSRKFGVILLAVGALFMFGVINVVNDIRSTQAHNDAEIQQSLLDARDAFTKYFEETGTYAMDLSEASRFSDSRFKGLGESQIILEPSRGIYAISVHSVENPRVIYDITFYVDVQPGDESLRSCDPIGIGGCSSEGTWGEGTLS